ncbi:uncharacterized protein LOC116950125 isoform X2 [Petromyzon marinus]|uniref:uncharacterized protein LOC116950125 isoform X2 n=1 Tax=Petromyzon marinus TaxID=7757 RepID=UPI003F71ADD2
MPAVWPLGHVLLPAARVATRLVCDADRIWRKSKCDSFFEDTQPCLGVVLASLKSGLGHRLARRATRVVGYSVGTTRVVGVQWGPRVSLVFSGDHACRLLLSGDHACRLLLSGDHACPWLLSGDHVARWCSVGTTRVVCCSVGTTRVVGVQWGPRVSLVTQWGPRVSLVLSGDHVARWCSVGTTWLVGAQWGPRVSLVLSGDHACRWCSVGTTRVVGAQWGPRGSLVLSGDNACRWYSVGTTWLVGAQWGPRVSLVFSGDHACRWCSVGTTWLVGTVRTRVWLARRIPGDCWFQSPWAQSVLQTRQLLLCNTRPGQLHLSPPEATRGTFDVRGAVETGANPCGGSPAGAVSRAMRALSDLLLVGAMLGCMAEQQVLVKRVQEGGTVVLNCTEASDVNHWFWLPDFQECAEGKPASEQFDGRIEMTSNPDCELVLRNLTARDAGKLIVPESMHRNVELVITPDCTGLHIQASPHGPFMVSASVNLTCRLPRHVSSATPVRWTFFTLGKGAAEQHGEVVTASREGLWTCTVGDRATHFCLSKSSSSTMNGWWCNETKLVMSEVGRSSESSPWTISSLPMPLLIAVCVGAALLPLLLLSAIIYACFMRNKVLLSPYATQYDCKPHTMLPDKAMAVPNHVLDRYQESVEEDCGEEYVPMSGLSQGSGTEIEIELQDYENISKSETVSGNAEAQPRRNEDVYFNDDLYGEVE